MKNGDLIFIGITNPVMWAVSEATSSWANHLGMAFHTDEGWRVYESILASTSDRPLCQFLKRARTGQVEVRRLKTPLSPNEENALWEVMQTKMGTPYDVSFNFRSRGQYCSKLIYQVYEEALGVEVGEVESFRNVYSAASKKGRKIFKFWFFRGVPWDRLTVTPRSQLLDDRLQTVWSYRPNH